MAKKASAKLSVAPETARVQIGCIPLLSESFLIQCVSLCYRADVFRRPLSDIFLDDLAKLDRTPSYIQPVLRVSGNGLLPLPEGIISGQLINVEKSSQRAKLLVYLLTLQSSSRYEG